ncbi:hypothetical protein QOZ80_2BG0181010 [Eleusine coracana subsp. coracana]|nr:hypothetical protein QOZ80_2BG0181010 [Eleusine coracana subsp. coracana]
MVLWLLRQLQGAIPPLLGKGEVMQDLEYCMRTKEDITRLEDARLTAYNAFARRAYIGAAGLYSFIGWFTTGIGCSYLTGKVIYYAALRMCAELILENGNGEDCMKMELANIILTKHSDDKLLVESVKRQFIAEHLFNDLHQDKPLFRWRPHHSYVDRSFMERLKEMEDEVNNSFMEKLKEMEDEVNNSNDEETSISRQTNRSFGDIMHDPLGCVLGSPGKSMESNSNPTDKTCTTLKKSEPRALGRSLLCHRHLSS